jgi:DNA-binding MarR family transcriptional regulator
VRTAQSRELAGRLALTTTRLARLLRQQDESDLPLTLRSALASIERHGPLTHGELGQIEHVAPPTVTKVVGNLEGRGYVERQPDAADRRVCRVAITRAGAARLATDRKRRTAWLAGRVGELDAGDRARLEGALDVVEAIIRGGVEA